VSILGWTYIKMIAQSCH